MQHMQSALPKWHITQAKGCLHHGLQLPGLSGGTVARWPWPPALQRHQLSNLGLRVPMPEKEGYET